MGCLGIDTSCYRTSLAYADAQGFAQRRELLEVPQGKRGLMQSEMVFQHVRNLPVLLERLMEDAWDGIHCVCASVRPRPVPGSYMPAFTVGESAGRALAAALRVPFYQTTHQQCHLSAALADARPEGEFLALHLSGGTTELLLADTGLNVRLLGGTSDLNAGQLVDRVGVALGCLFPAGPELERLAERGAPLSSLPTALNGLSCSFSGAEAHLMRIISSGAYEKETVAAEVYSFVARTLAKLLTAAARETGVRLALIFGGVGSSALLRQSLSARMAKMGADLSVLWARPDLAGDNAVGAALLGWRRLQSGDEGNAGENY